MNVLRMMKIASRLLIGFGALMVLIVLISALSVVSGRSAQTSIADVARFSGNQALTERAEKQVERGRMHIWMALGSGDTAHWDQAAEAFKAAHRDIDELVTNTRDPGRKAEAALFRERFTTFEAAVNKLRAFGGSNAQIATPEGRAVFANALARGRDMTQLGDGLTRRYASASEAQIKASNARTATFLWITAIVALASLALGLILSTAIARSINRPIQALTSAMGALASGNLGAAVPAAVGRDEVSAMARTVQVFKDNGLKAKALEAEAEQMRADAAAEQARTEAERRRVEAEQAKVVNTLAASLGRLADGDLTTQIDAQFDGQYLQIKTDFNSAVDSLRDAMRAISVATGGIRGGSDEIATASDDMSRRTEQQAASLEETAAALEEITSTVKRSAEGARQVATAASSAKTDAARSGAVMAEAVSAMGEIAQSSVQITQIISVIDEIAFQTNLLALNAGVEAARAGDAGRGFAVVAQEVRALAQRSAEAAKEIKALIASSSSQVEKGVKLVGDTGQALGAIVSKVADIDQLISEIAQSSQEQSTGLSQVNAAVSQMDHVTQQNAAMVEQATAAASNLKTEAAELVVLLDRFRTDPQHRPSARLELAQPGRPAPARTSAPYPREKLAASAGRGAAAASAAALAEDWAEF